MHKSPRGGQLQAVQVQGYERNVRSTDDRSSAHYNFVGDAVAGTEHVVAYYQVVQLKGVALRHRKRSSHVVRINPSVACRAELKKKRDQATKKVNAVALQGV